MKIMFCDVETTGLNKNKDEIIQLAYLVYNDKTDAIEDVYGSYLEPGNVDIKEKAFQVHGIWRGLLEKKGIDREVAKWDFVNGLLKVDCFASYGVNFDWGFVKRFALMYIDTVSVKKLCVMRKMKDFYGLSKYASLTKMVDSLRYNSEIKKQVKNLYGSDAGFHDARFDAVAAMTLYRGVYIRIRRDGEHAID